MITKQQIIDALHIFDEEYRATWGSLKNTPTILFEGELYPIQQIMRISTRNPLFSRNSVEKLREFGFCMINVKAQYKRSTKQESENINPIIAHYAKERHFEDDFIIPLLKEWNVKYQREYICKFPDGAPGRIDVFVSDDEGTLTLFENKLSIRTFSERQKAVEQAKKYALWYRLPSFVIATPQDMQVYAFDRRNITLKGNFLTKKQDNSMLLLLRRIRDNEQ
ncbi:MAG: hypothetical protein WCK01_05875 [Candidatus Uhrbacteria bacterium]